MYLHVFLCFLLVELKTFLQAASATDKYLVDVIQQSLGQPSEQEQIELVNNLSNVYHPSFFFMYTCRRFM